MLTKDASAERTADRSPNPQYPLPRFGPSAYLGIREAGSAIELARLFTRLPALARCPRGRGEPVIVLPGFGASDGSTLVLRSTLRYLGYSVSGWGLGLNTGNVERLLPEVAELVARRAQGAKTRIRLVGWSLGGILAREVAREAPQHVDRVVTLGSPVVGGPKYTATARFYRALKRDLDEIEKAIEERESTPIEVPITAIYTESDGIVDWRACIDRRSPRVEHIPVRSTHCGLGFSPEVLRIVAERLAVYYE